MFFGAEAKRKTKKKKKKKKKEGGMKIQPLDVPETSAVPPPPPPPPGAVAVSGKSRLRRLFDRHGNAKESKMQGTETETETSSLCLANMVRNFLEETNEEPSRCGRSRCGGDSTRDDCSGARRGNAYEVLQSLMPCESGGEVKLLAYASRVVEKNKISMHNDGIREIVAKGLVSLGYDAAICISSWEKFPSFPAGRHKYVDVTTGAAGDRVLIDVDFRSEFEIARPTKIYRSVLQLLPCVFVGKADRLERIVAVVSGAAARSLKKKGLHVAPWRTVGYMKAKWLSTYERMPTTLLHSDRTTNRRGAEEEVELKKSGRYGVAGDWPELDRAKPAAVGGVLAREWPR